MSERIGILGGAFNPPHVGHLALAEEAAHQLDLARVLLIPTGRARHKEIEDDPGGEARVAMARAAATGGELLEVDGLEIEGAARSTDPSYTHVTLEEISKRDPGSELVLLMGADTAIGLPRWKDPARVVELAELGIAMRPGSGRKAVEEALSAVGGAVRLREVEMPQLEISSTEVRRRVASGEPFRYLVGDAVADVIEAEGLYR